jgi:drug/metabolite transporter (DMT)-like permease
LAISISLLALLAVAVWLLHKFADLKLWHGVVCVLFGFYLASSSVAPEISTTVTSIIHAFAGQR